MFLNKKVVKISDMLSGKAFVFIARKRKAFVLNIVKV